MHKASKEMMSFGSLVKDGRVIGYNICAKKVTELAFALFRKYSENGPSFKINPERPITRKISIDLRDNDGPELQVSIEFPEVDFFFW